MIRFDKYLGMTDKSFIQVILDGDEEARLHFREIYIDSLVRSVISKKYSCLKSDAEDICQDLWVYFAEKEWQVLRNFQKLPDEPEPPKLRPYLYVVISRFVARHPLYKRILFRHFVPLILDDESDYDPLEQIADPSPGPDRVLENEAAGEKIGILADILLREVLIPNSPAGLSERELQILRLRCIACRPSREVAELFGMRTGAVDTALSRAKKKICDFCDAKNLLDDIREVLRDAAES